LRRQVALPAADRPVPYLGEGALQRCRVAVQCAGEAIGLAAGISHELFVAQLDRALRHSSCSAEIATPCPRCPAHLARPLELGTPLGLDPEARVRAIGLLRIVAFCTIVRQPAALEQ